MKQATITIVLKMEETLENNQALLDLIEAVESHELEESFSSDNSVEATSSIEVIDL